MRYWININQVQCLEWKLNVSESIIFSILYDVSNWAESATFEGKTYHFISRNKIQKEIPLLGLKSDTIYRYMKSLKEKELIDHIKIANKDYVRILPKGKKWNSVENPQSGIRSDARKKIRNNSEKNPSEVGKKSESNSEKNPTYTNTNIDTNTNVYPNTKDNTENQVFGSFADPEKDDPGASSLKSIPKKEKKETGAQKKEKEVISEVMDYLNEKIGRSLRKDSTAARQIWHRYKDGATVEEMKKVIDDKAKEWIDGEMKKYLHPSTLFLKRNYEKYVEQLPSEPEVNHDRFFEKVKPEIDNQIKESKLLMIWDEKQNTSLISIYKKIKDLMIENGEDPKINAATEMICWVIKSMDDFHRNNFSIDYLDRNFIKILNQVKNEKDNKRNKGIDSIREFSRALGEELGI